MPKTWIEEALVIGETIMAASVRHPELEPLYTSWVNYMRKRNRRNAWALIKRLNATVKRQQVEIRALDKRISTLLR